MIAHFAGDRAKCFQICEKVANVFDLRMLVGGIGKGGKVMGSAGRDSFGHGIDELGLGPSPDTVDRIGRNIRRVERPEWRGYCEAPAELQAVGLAGHGMAGGTSTGVECCKTVGEVWGVGRCGNRRRGRGRRQPPEDCKADGRGNNQAYENSSQHSPVRRYRFHLTANMPAA